MADKDENQTKIRKQFDLIKAELKKPNPNKGILQVLILVLKRFAPTFASEIARLVDKVLGN